MDSKGRAFDNIFVERLWRTVKYENVYLRGYHTMPEAHRGLAEYFQFYNNERYHQALNYKTPKEIYFGPKGGIHISTAIHKEKEKKKQKKKKKLTTTITNLIEILV